jgi:hypothetical protein
MVTPPSYALTSPPGSDTIQVFSLDRTSKGRAAYPTSPGVGAPGEVLFYPFLTISILETTTQLLRITQQLVQCAKNAHCFLREITYLY